MAVNESRNPFLGFRPYGPSDSDRLFGRDEDLSLLRSRLLSSRTTLLFAGSGVGKTSFIRAKLEPELKESYLPIYHNTWQAGEAPLTAVLNTVERELESSSRSLMDAFQRESERPFLLILDQFEEVFQYYRDTDQLALLVNELARIASDRAVDARIIFSMREEFLGELSVFDDAIPDLFNNYYRLKHPDWRMARQIIKRTAETVAPNLCSDSGLKLLLDDLRAFRMRSAQAEVAVSLRSYVVPPYLQIVCQRIWERERPVPSGTQFLSTYQAGNTDQQLKEYIQEKLAVGEGKILTIQQSILAAKAFDHLVSPHGAKKAFTFKQLSELIGLKDSFLVDQLDKTLQILAQPRVGILHPFESEGDHWFELYHDMYAPMLRSWREAIQIDQADHDLEAERTDIGTWELNKEPLDAFWVYLPNFLADPSPTDPFFTTMLSNFERKRTEYVYILRTRDDLERLMQLVENIDKEIASNGQAGKFSAWRLVKVVVLGVGGTGDRVDVFSRLLHLNNYWIANPNSDSPEGFEVVWDSLGEKVLGGRQLPAGKCRQVLKVLKALFRCYPPQTLECVRDGKKLKDWLRSSPIGHLRVIEPAPKPVK